VDEKQQTVNLNTTNFYTYGMENKSLAVNLLLGARTAKKTDR